MSDARDPRAWVEKADADLLTIKYVLRADDAPWDVVCFHAQQAAEKMLKAFIVSQKRTPAKTHDLTALWNECMELGAPIGVLEGDCVLLLRYAAASRYPGDDFLTGRPQGEAAYAAADRVYAAMLPLLHSDTIP